MENPLLTQAATLLTTVVRQQVALPCSLEQLEATLHPLAHALARQTAQQLAAESESPGRTATAGVSLWNMGVGYVAGLVLWHAYQRGWLKA